MLSWDVVKFSAVGIALAILIYAAVQYARIIHVEWCAWGPWYGWVVGLIGAALTLWGGLNWGIEPRTEISVRQYWLDNAFAALAALVGLATVGFMAWHFALMPQSAAGNPSSGCTRWPLGNARSGHPWSAVPH